jgi:D-sedoheptulose 7-phosphate isomerase
MTDNMTDNRTEPRPADPKPGFLAYADRLHAALGTTDWAALERLAHHLRDCWREGRQVFLCGNGGSAANALHIANDLFYGIARSWGGPGLRIHALPANVSVLTCLANDEGYDNIFSQQLANLAHAGDVLIVLSGSGNSPNILAALKQARAMGLTSYAVLGYCGGAAKGLADSVLHFAVDDMQVSEDLQVIVGHMIMQWLAGQGPGGLAGQGPDGLAGQGPGDQGRDGEKPRASGPGQN